MKKSLPYIICILIGLAVGIIVTGAIYAMTGFSIFGRASEKPTSSTEVDNAELVALAYQILEYIRDGDYTALSSVVHSEYGIVLSPCATIDLKTNRCFQTEQIAAFGNDMNLYVWGKYSGSGEPIEMTPVDYFAEFVYDRDYSRASVIGANYIVRSGNALENITDVFSNAQFIDFHYPGNGNGAEDMAWSSLRLGFEEHDGSLWLTLILRSAWTV